MNSPATAGAEDVPAWFIAILEAERSQLLKLIDHKGSLVPSPDGERYLAALQTCQALIHRARRPPDTSSAGRYVRLESGVVGKVASVWQEDRWVPGRAVAASVPDEVRIQAERAVRADTIRACASVCRELARISAKKKARMQMACLCARQIEELGCDPEEGFRWDDVKP